MEPAERTRIGRRLLLLLSLLMEYVVIVLFCGDRLRPANKDHIPCLFGCCLAFLFASIWLGELFMAWYAGEGFL